MKILLVMPAAEHLRITEEGQNVPRRKMLRFGVLSLLSIASATPDKHEVRICDENVQPLDKDYPADLVGVSFMTALAPRAYQIAEFFRRRGAKVVAGGFYPTFRPEEVAQHFDSVVIGEAEDVWPQLLADAQAGKLKKLYSCLVPPDLATLRPMRRDLLAARNSHYGTVHAVQTGRGCRHSCRFCSVAAFSQSTYRRRPLEHVLTELATVPRYFMFADDNIIADVEFAKALFRAMVPLKKRWISQCSVKIADDPELLSLARAAGCLGMFVGVETLSKANLDAVDKGFNDSSDAVARIARIRRAGIGVQAGIIVGLDQDDVTVFERTLRFLQRARIDALQLAIFTPLPGTPMHADFQQAGRIVDADLAHYDFRHAVIAPAKMTRQQLQDGADWLYHQYYRLNHILLRTLRAAVTLGPASAVLIWKLSMTYRYDNRRESIVGSNPAALPLRERLWRWGIQTIIRPAVRARLHRVPTN